MVRLVCSPFGESFTQFETTGDPRKYACPVDISSSNQVVYIVWYDGLQVFILFTSFQSCQMRSRHSADGFSGIIRLCCSVKGIQTRIGRDGIISWPCDKADWYQLVYMYTQWTRKLSPLLFSLLDPIVNGSCKNSCDGSLSKIFHPGMVHIYNSRQKLTFFL